MTTAESRMAFLSFAFQQAPGVGPAALRRVLAWVCRAGLSAERILDLGTVELSRKLKISPTACESVRSPTAQSLQTWEKLQDRGVEILLLGQPGYPQRMAELLGDNAPPILYVAGAGSLFKKPAVGFCGSRKASEKGLNVAAECAGMLAHEDINVISGYAHGIDLAAHEAALEAGGTTTLVLAEGILHFKPKEQIKRFIEQSGLERIAVVSEFPPGLPWKAHSAMARNRTICGMANALIVIESGLEGGTFEAGKTALDLGEPLFCVEYAEPAPSAAGNPYFLQRGAISLRRSRWGRPNLERVLGTVRNSTGSNRNTNVQNDLLTREEAK